jgi:hypothetical protein
MGLLDDAIREHLELKRRRGADPGEVAREQRDALEPVPRDPSRASRGELALAEGVAAGGETASEIDGAADRPDVEAQIGAESPPEDLAVAPGGGADGIDPSNAIQETAELDMQTVLDGDQNATAAKPGDAAANDSLEWEVPGDHAVEPHADGRREQHAAAADANAADREEDVLEETPDFLRDTPEQDRLWFEQRPPRDFDFDK